MKKVIAALFLSTALIFGAGTAQGAEISAAGVENEVCGVTINFDANGGSGVMAPLAPSSNAAVTIPANVFTRKNYTFSGWNTRADGKGDAYAQGDDAALLIAGAGDGQITLYAPPSPTPPCHTH